jgi:hypothetical protein
MRGVIAAMVAPFDDTGERVAVERIPARVDNRAKGGVHGSFTCGTTGEAPSSPARNGKRLPSAYSTWRAGISPWRCTSVRRRPPSRSLSRGTRRASAPTR